MTKKIFFSFLLFSLLLWPLFLKAASKCTGGSNCTGTTKATCETVQGCAWMEQSGTVSPKSSACVPGPDVICLDNPLNVESPQALIGKVINSILGVVGSLALLMFVYGGLTWMTSSGNQEKVKKGRDIIVWSAIGLAIIFISYALTRFVLSTVMK